MVSGVSVTASSASEERILLREFSHRIQNEFASLMAVVTLTAAQHDSDDVRRALAAVRERLYRAAQLHRVLEMPDSDVPVDASSHLQLLCASISRARLESQKIALALDTQSVTLRAGQSWRLNMIVAELITNAARHAFNGGPGSIRVALSCSGPVVECCVTDSGCGSRPVRPGVGLHLIAALGESLGGKIEQHFGAQGSVSLLAFPLRDAADEESLQVCAESASGDAGAVKNGRPTH